MAIATHYEPANTSMTGDTAFIRGPHQGNLGGYSARKAADRALYVTAYATYSSLTPIRYSGAGVAVTAVA